jgi:Uma2 family endonuclease
LEISAMATVELTTRYKPRDLLTFPEPGRFELVDGHLVERKMGAESSLVAQELRLLIGIFNKQHKLGLIFGPDCGFQIFKADRNRVRFADGSFVRRNRLPAGKPPKGHCRTVPELTIEAVSPNDTAEEVEQKVEEWLAAGVKLVWVVFPDSHRIHVHRKNGTTSKLGSKDSLAGEDVLPGFKCRVAEIFQGL